MFKRKSPTTTESSATTALDKLRLNQSKTALFHLPVNLYGRTEIHDAAMDGCLENMYWDITSENFYLDQLDYCHRTALHYASVRGDVKAAQILLVHGANPNIADMYGYAPMHYAAEIGHTSVVRELIKNKGAIHQQTKGGTTPLHLAALNGRSETEKLLLDSEANVNQEDNSLETELHFASLIEYLTIVKMLLSRETEVNSILNGRMALHYEEVKELLLGHGAILGQEISESADAVLDLFCD